MLNEIALIFFYVIILLYSVILHEVAHGVMAFYLGDLTAKYAGRLSANPLRHIDPMMTIFMPLVLLVLSGGRFAFGGAKPVPYNPYNLRDQKRGPIWVALAGPGSNIIIAFLGAFFGKMITVPLSVKVSIINSFKMADWQGLSVLISNSFGSIFFAIIVMIVFWNVILAFFNLIPIPPLDGSKVLFSILPARFNDFKIALTRQGPLILIGLIFLSNFLGLPIFTGLFRFVINLCQQVFGTFPLTFF